MAWRVAPAGLWWTDRLKTGILSVSLWRRMSHQPRDFAALFAEHFRRMRP
jgi:hypothetical protein